MGLDRTVQDTHGNVGWCWDGSGWLGEFRTVTALYGISMLGPSRRASLRGSSWVYDWMVRKGRRSYVCDYRGCRERST